MQHKQPNRRDALKATIASSASLAWASIAGAQTDSAQPATTPSLISNENAKPGAIDWQLTRVRTDTRGGIRSSLIEGYCSKQSVAAGESIDICVSTNPPQDFMIEIFRTGYYGGRGARLMKTIGPLKGITQPTPEYGEKRLRECRWQPAVTLTIPDDWPSGVYLGRLTTLSDARGFGYWQSYVVFIVRDDRPADILLQCSDNTWQAYNQWPENDSVYTNPKGNQGPWSDVSFDRPYGKVSADLRKPSIDRLGRVAVFRVSDGVLVGATWLRRHLLQQQRHADARPRIEMQGLLERRA